MADGKTCGDGTDESKGTARSMGSRAESTSLCKRFLQVSTAVFLLSVSVCVCALTVHLCAMISTANSLMSTCDQSVKTITVKLESLPNGIGEWFNTSSMSQVKKVSEELTLYKKKYDTLVDSLKNAPIVGPAMQKFLREKDGLNANAAQDNQNK